MSVVDKALQTISKVWHGLFGDSKLNRYENVCISAWSDVLPTEMKNKLKIQLDKFNLIQRQSSGLKSVFYDVNDSKYKYWDEEVLFPVRKLDLKVFSGCLVGRIEDIEMKIKFKIFLHRGRLSSIEFDSVPTFMEKCDSFKVNNKKSYFDF